MFDKLDGTCNRKGALYRGRGSKDRRFDFRNPSAQDPWHSEMQCSDTLLHTLPMECSPWTDCMLVASPLSNIRLRWVSHVIVATHLHSSRGTYIDLTTPLAPEVNFQIIGFRLDQVALPWDLNVRYKLQPIQKWFTGKIKLTQRRQLPHFWRNWSLNQLIIVEIHTFYKPTRRIQLSYSESNITLGMMDQNDLPTSVSIPSSVGKVPERKLPGRPKIPITNKPCLEDCSTRLSWK